MSNQGAAASQPVNVFNSLDKQETPRRWDWRAANQRRAEAARRLPPLPCGCRDPFTVRHREGRCKWGRRGER